MTGTKPLLPSYTGEIYSTMAKPHQEKGRHYHTIAKEWFTLIK